MEPEPQGDLTRLIFSWQAGDKAAENRLFDLVYDDLRKRAHYLNLEFSRQSLGSAGLVNQAYIQMRKSGRISFNDRAHFLNFAACVMRHVVLDRVRAESTVKRGGDVSRIPGLDLSHLPAEDRTHETALLNELLALPGVLTNRQHQVLDMLYFAEYTTEEAAILLGVSSRTVKREFESARSRLRLAAGERHGNRSASASGGSSAS